jgi:hypothetical protein
VDLPGEHREAIERAVADCLAAELRARGLLLPAARFAPAERTAESDGLRLLTSVIHRCYPLSEYDTQVVTVEFDSEAEASRVRSALAFGAATAELLMAPVEEDRRDAVSILSAIFNLGIGLVDGVCDEDAGVGLRLLNLIDLGNMPETARHRRPRGWLRVELPAELESTPSVSFAADVVETFFATLHAVFPGDSWSYLRGQVGDQLAAALAAERSSLAAALGRQPPGELVGYSYATSVVPFEIVGTLAASEHAPAAARFLGEAMWRIDDLVDLCDDAQTGALNAILLTATDAGRSALEGLLASDHIARVAAEAANSLLRGLELADGHGNSRYRDVFLHFIARYAGIGGQES